MKKLIYTLFLSTLAFGSTKAQYADNAIKLNMFGYIVGQYTATYERALNENFSAQLTGGVISRNSEGKYNNEGWDGNTFGIILIPEARYYFEEALSGAYLGAFFRYRSATTDVDLTFRDADGVDYSYENTRSAIGGGFVVGYQAVLSDAIVLDIFLGPQTKTVTSTRKYKDPRNEDGIISGDLDLSIPGIDNDGVGVRFGINLGFVF